MKKYLFQFNGTVVLEAENYNEAENIVENLKVDDYVITENLYETDQYFIIMDKEAREYQLGTYHHPIDNPNKFELFKVRHCKYISIFRDFLNGVIDQKEVIEKISNVDDKEIPDDCDLYASIKFMELNNKTFKTIRLLTVD
jgi:hypothetical protein